MKITNDERAEREARQGNNAFCITGYLNDMEEFMPHNCTKSEDL